MNGKMAEVIHIDNIVHRTMQSPSQTSQFISPARVVRVSLDIVSLHYVVTVSTRSFTRRCGRLQGVLSPLPRAPAPSVVHTVIEYAIL